MTSPTARRDFTDPGDEVTRRFRYQHAYGVILLAGAATQRLPYTAVWCEQHEDFLAEIAGGTFDAYQVKTRQPERGAWKLSDEELYSSIGRFVGLDLHFPDKIRGFTFVSNCGFSNSSRRGSEHLSPINVLGEAQAASRPKELGEIAKRGLEYIQEKTSASLDTLLSVFHRLQFVQGPTLRAFEDELCQTHIASLPECRMLNPSSLARVREALIGHVNVASSLCAKDPNRHWAALAGDSPEEAFLQSKRIAVVDVTLFVREASGHRAQFPPELALLEPGRGAEKLDRMLAKMVRGGLVHHYEMMRRRALTAEQVLIDLATRPDEGEGIRSQMENVVFGECDDAHLRAASRGEPFGHTMLIDVQDRLKSLTENDPPRACGQTYDVLVGVAGLLTSDCRVWWSEPFDLGDAP